MPVSIAAHQAAPNQRLAAKIAPDMKNQATYEYAHKIGYRLQFVQNIVYNLAETLRTNSV
ncbi:hypothetical protein ATY81_19215 [Rhizobium sp. R72]|nr:hypothetical protein ATY81_19215 [Rhizobium sp. R72]OWW03439.1 hypothetical protein ATY80_19215 [Rhizobium sp. R711]